MSAMIGDSYSTRAAQLLAKLTGKGLQPGIIFGGKAELDRMDVAAALAGHNLLAYLLNRAKYCDDVSCILEAVRILANETNNDERIREAGDKTFRIRLCAMILEEWRSGNLCKRCRGRGSLYPTDGPAYTCPVCEGKRKKEPTAISRSRAFGIPVADWRAKRLQAAVSDWLREMHHREVIGLWYVAEKLGVFHYDTAENG